MNEVFEPTGFFASKKLRLTTPNLTASRPRQPPFTILTFNMLFSVGSKIRQKACLAYMYANAGDT